MGSMTENIADKAINDTRIVKQFTNPVKEPIDSDINLFDLLDNRAKRDPEGRIQFVSATLVFGLAAFDCSLAISSSHTSLGVL